MALPRRTPIRPKAPPAPRVTSITAQPTTGGLPYSRQQAPGGTWHTYPGGRRVFVRAGAPKAAAAPGPSMEDAIRADPNAMAGLQAWFDNGQQSAPAAEQPSAPAAEQPSAASQAAADPYDAQYYAQRAQDEASRKSKGIQLDADSASDKVNYSEAMRRFREQQPKQLRNNLVNANRSGLAQSSTLDESNADTVVQNRRQSEDMTGAFDGREEARRAARKALADGASLDEATAAAAAADRKINYYTERADEGSLARNAPQAPEQAPGQGDLARAPAPARAPARASTRKAALVQKRARVAAKTNRTSVLKGQAAAVAAAKRKPRRR